MMNYRQVRKLRRRVMVAIISILSCIAVMAVGVYAASTNYHVAVANEVKINFSHVDGELYGRRDGDVIYGEVSMGDGASGFVKEEMLASTLLNPNADAKGFLTLYGYEPNVGYHEYEANMNEIKEHVNFYLSATDEDGNKKDELTIYYVFKYVYNSESSTNTTITLENNSTDISKLENADYIKEHVGMSYKYYFGADEPTDWTTQGSSFGIDDGGSQSITVHDIEESEHIVYIYASMTVKRTNKLGDEYSLGMDDTDGDDVADKFHWAFSLTLSGQVVSSS